MRPLCDRVILVLILVLKVPRGASVPRLLEKITQNGQKRQISDEKRPEIVRFQVFFGGDKRDRTADLLNAMGPIVNINEYF